MQTQQVVKRFETLIGGLTEKGFGLCDDFLLKDEITALRDELVDLESSGKLSKSGVGRTSTHQLNELIRNDLTFWLSDDGSHRSSTYFLGYMNSFIQYLNETCFTSINSTEFHFAVYTAGSFYKRHIDTFKSDDSRKFSFVLYLNEEWKSSEGGELRLYLSTPVNILPIGGRAVFFRSDQLEHEVLSSPVRNRMSIAGWLKTR